jgi:peptidoglycan hydrolase-like protein with peptidoglycan-binding domain
MPTPPLRLNSTGPAVRQLTKLLRQRGYLDRESDTFDSTVRRAVKEFQSRHVDERDQPLVVDGVVGPLTWWALEQNAPATVRTDQRAFEQMPANGGSTCGRAALEAAINELRNGATESGQNNDGSDVVKYLNGVVSAPANWCAGFVSWCFAQQPGGIPFRYSVGARDIREQFRRKNWLHDGAAPEPGDIIVWWRDRPDGWMGHIGLVHRCENGIVYTIEGNKGNYPARVRGFDYVLGRIDRLLGFGRVPNG